MTKIYVMESCPDCTQAKQLYGENPDYEIIDIGKQARSLKEFLVIRDNHPAFAKVRERGTIGIPCFVKEDGTVIISMKHYEASLAEGASEGRAEDGHAETGRAETGRAEPRRAETGHAETGHAEEQSAAPDIEDFTQGAACNLDGTGC